MAVRPTPRPRKRKRAKSVTCDVLAELIAICGTDSLRDIRDRAILMVEFASGGRRRSEISSLIVEQLTIEAPIIVENGPPLPSLSIHLGRTKTSGSENDDVVHLTGRPVDSLDAWISLTRIEGGSVFRKIDRWGNLSNHSLEPSAINAILKQPLRWPGCSRKHFPAGLRSAFLTEAANRGIPLPEAIEQSRHRLVQPASSYYNNATRRSGQAARLL